METYIIGTSSAIEAISRRSARFASSSCGACAFSFAAAPRGLAE